MTSHLQQSDIKNILFSQQCWQRCCLWSSITLGVWGNYQWSRNNIEGFHAKGTSIFQHKDQRYTHTPYLPTICMHCRFCVANVLYVWYFCQKANLLLCICHFVSLDKTLSSTLYLCSLLYNRVPAVLLAHLIKMLWEPWDRLASLPGEIWCLQQESVPR